MKDPFGDRMKGNYEQRAQHSLLRRTPVIIRVDGKCFSKFCKRFKTPYDPDLNYMLNETMFFLCKNIQGAKFAERHSDEISILVTDYDTIKTDAYFDYEIQKICSVVASMASTFFARRLVEYEYINCYESWPIFDARCFNLPEDEVENYFWWRMRDAVRNSIGMLSRSLFSHEALIGKNQNEVQEMMFHEHGVNWNDLNPGQKAGYVCYKKWQELTFVDGRIEHRHDWEIHSSPMLKSDLDEIMDETFTVRDQVDA